MSDMQGLGGHRVFDPRNLNHLIVDVLPYDNALYAAGLAASRSGGLGQLGPKAVNVPAIQGALKATAGRYYYDANWHGDQGSTPRCTGFAGVHLLTDGPIVQGKKGVPPMDPATLYAKNQENDRAMGNSWAEGASSLALGQALVQLGYATRYLWGYDLDSFLQAIKRGPVLFGTDWLEGMDSPDKKHGLIRAIGRNRGGHELIINGADLDDGIVRLKNSWGRAWGRGGHAYLPFEDFEKLLGMGGDLLFIEEVRPGKV